MINHESFLFDPLYIEQEISKIQVSQLHQKMDILKNWVNKMEVIKEQSEKQLQAIYLNDIFYKILDYNTINEHGKEWNMEYENATELDSSTPDCILGFYSDNDKITKAVIELKGPKVNLDLKQKRGSKNYGTPVDQAYSYAPKFDGCEWIIVSNIYEIRLYKNGISQHYYERFFLEDIATNEKLF